MWMEVTLLTKYFILLVHYVQVAQALCVAWYESIRFTYVANVTDTPKNVHMNIWTIVGLQLFVCMGSSQ
jgi:hypothetical protein